MADLIPSDAVKAIQNSVETRAIDVDGQTYLTRQVFLPPQEPEVDTLRVSTLQGLVDYLTYKPEANIEPSFIHVVSHHCVRLHTAVQGRHQSRSLLIEADCTSIIGQGFQFGRYLQIDQMIVNLQAQFEPSEDRAKLLAVIGNLRSEKVQNFSDDGVSQTVTTRAGIARVGEAEVPNPVVLTPYRTFREVQQPQSQFVFRMQQAARDGEMPTCALFEADGGFWKLSAIESIQGFLEENCEIPILA